MEKPVYEAMRDYVAVNDLSQKAIALDMGYTQSRLSLLLTGKRRLLLDDYLGFCRAVSVSPTLFLPERGGPGGNEREEAQTR